MRIVMLLVLSIELLVTLSGCGLMGVKNMDAWGLKMEFQPGFDVNFGANSIDKVDNRKGVNEFKRNGSAPTN